MSHPQNRDVQAQIPPSQTKADSGQDAAMNKAISQAEHEREVRDRAESREVVLTLLFATLTLAFFGWQAG